jgi:hypothetical protein
MNMVKLTGGIHKVSEIWPVEISEAKNINTGIFFVIGFLIPQKTIYCLGVGDCLPIVTYYIIYVNAIFDSLLLLVTEKCLISEFQSLLQNVLYIEGKICAFCSELWCDIIV